MPVNVNNPAMRADERQREAVRDELHAIVDAAVNSWPDVERVAREMGRGYSPRAAGVAVRGSGYGDPVGEVDYDRAGFDPAAKAEGWVALLHQFRALARKLESELRALNPPRSGAVAVCLDCGQPVREGQVKRLDGQPYHKAPCWQRAYYRTRRPR